MAISFSLERPLKGRSIKISLGQGYRLLARLEEAGEPVGGTEVTTRIAVSRVALAVLCAPFEYQLEIVDLFATAQHEGVYVDLIPLAADPVPVHEFVLALSSTVEDGAECEFSNAEGSRVMRCLGLVHRFGTLALEEFRSRIAYPAIRQDLAAIDGGQGYYLDCMERLASRPVNEDTTLAWV